MVPINNMWIHTEITKTKEREVNSCFWYIKAYWKSTWIPDSPAVLDLGDGWIIFKNLIWPSISTSFVIWRQVFTSSDGMPKHNTCVRLSWINTNVTTRVLPTLPTRIDINVNLEFWPHTIIHGFETAQAHFKCFDLRLKQRIQDWYKHNILKARSEVLRANPKWIGFGLIVEREK